jgi:hypothetical protein
MKKLKPIPTFKTEADERKFWETPRLHRLPRLEQGRARALSEPETLDHGDFNSPAAGLAGADQDRRQQRDVPYQSLIKMWLAEKVR